MSHVVDLRGCGGNLPMPRAGTLAKGSGVVPHFFSVTTEEQRRDKWDKWMPFINSNYPRDGVNIMSNGADDWPLYHQLTATTAAPTFFQPMVHPSTGVQYVDGGISANNPASIALREASALWPDRP